jgi:hypothetical protein
MQYQHPDDRFALTDQERDEFRRIWKDLAADGTGRPAAGRADAATEEPVTVQPGWNLTAIICLLFVFIGLAADSVFVIVLASAGAFGAYLARDRHPL